MREHQIVISLKPEQFEEVQRLARATGSKSISAFLRQQIVASLGLGNSAVPVAASAAGPDIKQLAGELRRLHRELQIFVADSLPNNDYVSAAAPMEGSIPFPTAVQENFLAEGAPLMPESSYTQSMMSSPEQFPTAQTPIMPSAPMLPGQVSQALERGSMFSSSSFSLPTTSGYEDAPEGADTYSVAKQAMQSNPENPADEANLNQSPYAVPPVSGQPPYAIPPSLNPEPTGFESTIDTVSNQQKSNSEFRKIAYTEPEAPPEPIPASTPAPSPMPAPSAPAADPNTNPAQNAEQAAMSPNLAVQSFAENDELEDLADRAFAISPRLGPLSEAVRKFPDPLKDLLDDAFLNGLDEQENVDFPQEEDSEQTIPAQIETVEVEEDLEDFPDNEGYVEQAPIPTEVHSGSSTEHDELSMSAQAQTDNDQAEESADTDEPTQDLPPTIPPPISGGPPPRKRRT